MEIYIIVACAHNIDFQGVIFMPKFLKCTKECDAVIKIESIIDEEDEREPNERKLHVRIPEGWIFCFLGSSSSNSKYNLRPVEKSTETNVKFNAQDKKSFKQGIWRDITDVDVLRRLKLNELGDLSRLYINLLAPKSCFEEIK